MSLGDDLMRGPKIAAVIDRESLHRQARELRAAGLLMREISAKLGVHPRTVASWLRGGK